MEQVVKELAANFSSVEDLWTAINWTVGYIFVVCLVAAFLCWTTFHRIGYGPIGLLMVAGMTLLACSFAFLGWSAEIIIDMPLYIRLVVVLIGRLVQAVSVTLLVIAFYKYNKVAARAR